MSVERPQIEMPRPEARGRRRSRTINLDVMARTDIRCIADEPLSSQSEKTSQASNVSQSSRLQQGQTATASADKHKPCAQAALFARGYAAQFHPPAIVRLTQSLNFPATGNGTLFLLREPATQAAGEQSKVDFGALPNVSLTTGAGGRPSITSGAQLPISAGSDVNCISRKK